MSLISAKQKPSPLRFAIGFWLCAAAILAVAAGFRLYALGESAYRADTMTFYDICQRPLSFWAIMIHWLDLMGRTAQFPFPMAFTKACLNISHLPATFFYVRLPSALFGIATVAAFIAAGAILAGRRFGLFCGCLMALSPFHIQLAREAYYYPPLLLGGTILLGATMWAFRRRRQAMPFTWRYHTLLALGFFLTTYSHLSGWWLAVIIAPFNLWIFWQRGRRNGNMLQELGRPLGIMIGIGVWLLFAPWAAPYFIHDTLNPEIKALTIRIAGKESMSLIAMHVRTTTAMAWGNTFGRNIMLATAGMLFLLFLWRRRRADKLPMLLLALFVGALILYYMGRVLTATPYAIRHQAFIFPLFLLLLAYGLWHVASWPVLRRRWSGRSRVLLRWGVGISVLIPLAAPAIWSVQLPGKPVPYRQISEWCDTQLPAHMLVLVERWLDPWNELRVHNSTNIFFTFTVPAEPDDVFERFNWPATAREFFRHFPDAAYLEYRASNRARMGVVTNWHFARQVVFTNVAGIKLAQLGVAYRDDFYDPNTNRMETTIFYNTRKDVLDQARARGQPVVILYGSEWGYVKLWQQLQDFRDWRILEKEASLDVYNLTASTNRITLKMRGMALNGSKRVSAEGGENRGGYHDFRHLQLEEWPLKDITLRPGLNKIIFSDSLWSIAHTPLLVDQIEVAADH